MLIELGEARALSGPSGCVRVGAVWLGSDHGKTPVLPNSLVQRVELVMSVAAVRGLRSVKAQGPERLSGQTGVTQQTRGCTGPKVRC